nr:helix-turn-helix transcriptional regulator [Adlercreutzia mucosicola]
MALALLTSESAPVAFVIHTVGFVFFVALVWLFCTFLGQGCADGTRRFIVGLFANQAGQALGSLGYLGLVAAVGSSASALLPASLGTVYVLLLAALAFFANAGRAKRSVAAANALAVEPAVLLSSLAEGHRLTAREVEIGVLVAEGRSRAAIAEALVVSQETVKSHTKHLYQKLSVHSRDELMRLLEEEARLWADRRSIL